MNRVILPSRARSTNSAAPTTSSTMSSRSSFVRPWRSMVMAHAWMVTGPISLAAERRVPARDLLLAHEGGHGGGQVLIVPAHAGEGLRPALPEGVEPPEGQEDLHLHPHGHGARGQDGDR